jgi:gas vesicle protein
MNSGKIIVGTLAGLAAGALIGVLFAPDKGSEVRGKIVKKGEDYLDSVKGKINSLLDDVSGRFNGGHVGATETVGKTNTRESKKEMQNSAS